MSKQKKRWRPKQQALASQLVERHAIRAEVIVADLSRVGAGQAVFEEVQQRGLAVDILIDNAGLGRMVNLIRLTQSRNSRKLC